LSQEPSKNNFLSWDWWRCSVTPLLVGKNIGMLQVLKASDPHSYLLFNSRTMAKHYGFAVRKSARIAKSLCDKAYDT
jgi:hypothetical protein